MSENQQTAVNAAQATQDAIDAWSRTVAESLTGRDPQGNERIQLPLLQGYLDMRLMQVKLEALFEELDAQGLVEAKLVMGRFLRKLELERKQAQQAIDARPRVTPVQGAIAQAINGKKVLE